MNKTTNSDNGNYCVIYCRVSSKKQEEQGLSLDAQEKLLREWANEEGLKPVDVFKVQESATKPDRKKFRKMLDFCRENHIKDILIEKQDRLNRDDPAIDALIEEYAKKHDFSFHLFREKSIISKSMSARQRTINRVMGAIDGGKVRETVEDIQKAVLEKLEKGGYPGRIPLGYRAIPKTKTRSPQIIQTDEAPILKRFLEEFSTGKYSVHQSVRLAKDLGLKSETQQALPRSELNRKIKNRFYYGEFEWTHDGINNGNQKIFQNKTDGFVPIISKKTWEKNQAILKSRQKNFRKGKLAFKFNNLMTCGKCGRKIYGVRFDHNIEWETKNGQKVKKYKYDPYYLCTKGTYLSEDGEEKRCETPSFKEPELGQMLMDEFSLIKFNSKHWKEVKKALFKDETKDFINCEIRMLRSEQTKNENALDKMYSDYCDEIINAKFFKTRSDKIHDRQQEVKDRLAELEEEKEHFDTRIGKSIEVLDAMENWNKILKNSSDEKKNHLIKLLTIKILTVHNKAEKNGRIYEYKGLEFTYSPEVRELFEIGLLEADEKTATPKLSLATFKDDSLTVKTEGMSEAPLRI